MKNITNLNVTFLVTVVLVIGAGYYVLKYIPYEDPFELDDSYEVTIIPPQNIPSAQMKISNNSHINLRLHMFNAKDKVKGIARENWVLKKGESKTYARDDYVFHVFKSQAIDKAIMWTETIWTDLEFTGDRDNLEVIGGPKPPVSFTNEVDEQLKICVYEAKDRVQVIQIACWTFSKGRTIYWEDAPSLFLFKVFKPAALDKPLVTESDVKHMSKIIISKK